MLDLKLSTTKVKKKTTKSLFKIIPRTLNFKDVLKQVGIPTALMIF